MCNVPTASVYIVFESHGSIPGQLNEIKKTYIPHVVRGIKQNVNRMKILGTETVSLTNEAGGTLTPLQYVSMPGLEYHPLKRDATIRAIKKALQALGAAAEGTARHLIVVLSSVPGFDQDVLSVARNIRDDRVQLHVIHDGHYHSNWVSDFMNESLSEEFRALPPLYEQVNGSPLVLRLSIANTPRSAQALLLATASTTQQNSMGLNIEPSVATSFGQASNEMPLANYLPSATPVYEDRVRSLSFVGAAVQAHTPISPKHSSPADDSENIARPEARSTDLKRKSPVLETWMGEDFSSPLRDNSSSTQGAPLFPLAKRRRESMPSQVQSQTSMASPGFASSLMSPWQGPMSTPLGTSISQTMVSPLYTGHLRPLLYGLDVENFRHMPSSSSSGDSSSGSGFAMRSPDGTFLLPHGANSDLHTGIMAMGADEFSSPSSGNSLSPMTSSQDGATAVNWEAMHMSMLEARGLSSESYSDIGMGIGLHPELPHDPTHLPPVGFHGWPNSNPVSNNPNILASGEFVGYQTSPNYASEDPGNMPFWTAEQLADETFLSR